MKPYRLSEQAGQSLADIAYWTTLNFGPAQADRYIDLLVERMSGVASGKVQRMNCRDLFALDLKADLFLVRAGRHFIFLVETATEIRIIDIIHQSADIGGRLEGLEE